MPQVDEVKSVMVQNIEKVLERGERIELLVDKTDSLKFQVCIYDRESVSFVPTVLHRRKSLKKRVARSAKTCGGKMSSSKWRC